MPASSPAMAEHRLSKLKILETDGANPIGSFRDALPEV
jgi:hypothetical protein